MARDNANWLRKDDEDASKASFPELFFDLVFVFALIQLSHTLSSEFTSAAAFESLLLIFAIWWLWIHTTLVTNLLDATAEPVRLMLFAMMFGGVLMAIVLPEAFKEHGIWFALIYSVLQIGRSVFAYIAFREEDDDAAKTFVRMTVWSLVAGGFWIGGALMEIEGRVALWSIGLVIEYIAPAFRYAVPGLGRAPREALDISGEHMAERCALFVIICLGETILTTGKNAAEHMNTSLLFAVFCSAFLTTGLMWWIYFHRGQEETADEAEESDEPESMAHRLFTYGHLPIIAGIILTAVGEDFALSHAEEGGDAGHALAMLGGPALFLAGNIWIKLAAMKRLAVSHVAGIALLALTAIFQASTANYLIQFVATAILLMVATWEYVALKRLSASTA